MAEAAPVQEYRCLICTKPYTEPRKLPCGHTFCCRCLTSYIEAEHVTADEDRHYFPCPVCDSPIAPSDVNTDVSTWAECFPINTLFLSPTAVEPDVPLCAPCQRGEESSQAEVWCTDCGEKLCKLCRKYHERNRASEKHRLLSISKIAGEVRDVLVNEICPSHNGKHLDVYCVDHSEMCCSVCVSVSHRLCNNVKPIEDVIRKTEAEQQNRETDWKELRDETMKMVDDDDLGMTLITSNEKEVSAEMTKRIQEVKEKLDNLNEKFQSDLKETCKTLRQKISARRKCVYKFHINTENSHSLMSQSDQKISERHKFFMREQTKNQISGHYRRMDQNTKNQPNRFDVKLKLGTVIDEIMKMTTLGTIDVTSAISPISQDADVCIGSLIENLTLLTSTSGEPTTTSDLTGSLQHLTVQTTPVAAAVGVSVGVLTGTLVKSVTGRVGGLDGIYLTGGIFTDNNKLLVTDYNNKRILLFDDTYTYTREFAIDGNPTGIARGLADDEVFVAVSRTVILKLKQKHENGLLSMINKIWCPYDIWGIAVLGDTILVSTPDSVKVLTVDGKVTKTMKSNSGDSNLAISPSRGTVYYTDNNDVVCRRMDRDEVVYRYRDSGLRKPVGIGLDQDNNVYVCGHDSENVYMISPDGSRGSILVPKLRSLNKPCCVVVHPTRQEFVVISRSRWAGQSNYRIDVYRIDAT